MVMKNSILDQAKLFEGKDHWHSNGKPNITFSDGPNGLRIEDSKGIGFVHSKEATLFPAAVSAACSFDRSLLRKYGELLAEECMSEKIDVILGPLLTLLVYKQGKKTLLFDLTVIVLLQISALGYGLWTISQGVLLGWFLTQIVLMSLE